MATAQEGPGSAAGADALRERIEKRRQRSGDTASTSSPEAHSTFLQRMRGYLDALIFAFMLAMFIRSYVFELYQIPTGSMTPTLIGDERREVFFADYDGDNVGDVIYTNVGGSPTTLQVYLQNEDGTYKDQLFVRNVRESVIRELRSKSPGRKDMIVVNKFAYWFSTPDRGDIAVFKVPDNEIFEVDKPVYIKRVAALPGEEVVLQSPDRMEVGPGDPIRYSERFGGVEIRIQPKPMLINGEPMVAPPFDRLMHFPAYKRYLGFPIDNTAIPNPLIDPEIIDVPEHAVLMLGDNAPSSADGRYFGPLPLNHLRGRAIFRYVPVKAMGSLK